MNCFISLLKSLLYFEDKGATNLIQEYCFINPYHSICIKLLSDIQKGGGKLDGKEVVAADIESLELLIKTHQEAESKQKQLMEQFRQYLTATTKASIVNSIVEGFRNGKNSAADFADDFGLMMENALVNALKAKLMNQDMTLFYKKFSDYSYSDGVLTATEIAELKSGYNQLIERGKKRVRRYQEFDWG